MTEEYWQSEKRRREINKKNTHPVLEQTFKDKMELVQPKHPKALYTECLRGSLDIEMWKLSDNLSVDDMAMLVCKDVGCELTYCQMTLRDPYEQPFKDCEEQHRVFFDCMKRENRRFNIAPMGSLQEHARKVIEEKKKNKYRHLFYEDHRRPMLIELGIGDYRLKVSAIADRYREFVDRFDRTILI